MRFRPLCIDYHARAQEIAALERDVRARRAALAVLPLPHPSPPRNRTQANSPRCRDDGDGSLDATDGQLERREDKENWDEGNAAGNDSSAFAHRLKGDAADSEPAMEGAGEASKENDGPETSLRRLQSIAAMLGPAVHPSECAFRSIAPVTEGPVRGRKLPVTRAVASPLEEWTESGENYAETRRNAAVAALDSGRSRFDPRGVDNFLSILSNDRTASGGIALDSAQDTAFADTMAVVYARLDNGVGSGGFGTNADVDADKANDLKSLIWSQHVASLPMPKSLYLRHEPEDIAKIYRLQAARSSAINSSFASEAIQSFRPQLRALEEQREHPGIVTRKGLALVASAGDVSSKPRIDLLSRCNLEPRKQQDYGLRLSRVPFTQFLDDRHDVDAGEGVEMAPPFRALEFEDNARFAIRLDPDIDPLHPASLEEKEQKPLRELLKPLDELCSARSISARLGFPGRFEASHELTDGRSRALVSRTKHQPNFLREALKGFDESNAEEQSSDVLLAVLSARSTMNGAAATMPRKITLDADIDLPSLVLEGEAVEPTTPHAGKKSVSSLILELPSFSGMLSFAGKRRGSTGAGGGPRRFVVSSSRVSRVDALKHVASSSHAACLFLPQFKAQGGSDDAWVEKKRQQATQQSALRALASAVRSCVPSEGRPRDLELLQGQCPSYPVAPWFESDTNEASPPVVFDQNVMTQKRKNFCGNSRKVSSVETSRSLLLTGCSSRRNLQSRYSYRGLLTNEVVDSDVFQRRYSSMVAVNKLHNRPGNPETPAGTCNDPSFAQMALGTFAESITRRKGTSKSSKGGGTARGAPCSGQLKTQRHGLLKLQAGKATKTAPPKPEPNLLDGTQLAELASSCKGRALDTNEDDEGALGVAGSLVEALGGKSLESRAELLHLDTKARELEAEKQSYLAELAVTNRGRVNSPKRHPFEGPGETFDRAESGDGDLIVPVEKKASGKRKAPSEAGLGAAELAFDEHKAKREKKKRKKDRKKHKKAKRKKHRKRKHGDSQHGDSIQLEDGADPAQSNKKRKLVEATPRERAQPTEPSSKPKPAPIAKPLLPVGMTPIVPPKKLEASRKRDANDATESRTAEDSNQPPINSTFGASDAKLDESGGTRDKSPESVADLHPLRPPEREVGKRPSLEERGSDFRQRHASPNGSGFGANEPTNQRPPQSHGNSDALGFGSSERFEQPKDSSSALDVNTNAPIREAETKTSSDAPLTLLTSESFLETYGEIVSELASGRWQKALSESERLSVEGMSNGIVVCDTPLLDIAGADIELADNSAIVVQCLSSWSEDSQNGGSAMSMQQGARAFLRRLVSLAASGRYEAIHVILCLDVEISSALPGEISNLQNAVLQQSGCPCDHVTFEYVARRSIAASIALKSASVATPQESSKVAEFISADEDVQERARFLVMLLPSCSLHTAARCLGLPDPSSDSVVESGEALQDLFSLAKSTTRDLFPFKVGGVLPPICAQQLWAALNVDISHAHSG